MGLGRGGLGGTGVSSSGIITTAFFAFSSLAPSSVDPLSPQRTFKMKETLLSDKMSCRSRLLGDPQAFESSVQRKKMNCHTDIQLLFFCILMGSFPLIVDLPVCICVGVYVNVHVCLDSYVCGGHRSTSDVILQVPFIMCFETRSLSQGSGAGLLE